MSYLVVFRVSPDVDHIAPLVWKLLEAGEEVHCVLSPGLDPERDYRLRHIVAYERCHVWRGRAGLPWALAVVARTGARVVGVEWGYGLPSGYERPWSPRGLAAAVRTLVRSARVRDTLQLRSNLMAAARLLGRRVVCLPHGLSVKLELASNHELQAALENGGLHWQDRNRVDRYVFNTEHHRRFAIEQAAGDPDVMETWGSLRWSPQWVDVNRRIAPPFAWPAEGAGKLKVVFMVPKWKNRVHPERVVQLVRRLQELDFVSLAVKGHPRPASGDTDPLRADPAIDWDRILDVGPIDSVPLIAASDVVIDVGSSIGLEVVMQGKLLVNPSYLHEVRTLFDEIPGSCAVPRDDDELAGILRARAAGDGGAVTDDAAVRELLRRAVYGDRPEPFDIPDLYLQRLRALADPRS